jgi:hypothetical protein
MIRAYRRFRKQKTGIAYHVLRIGHPLGGYAIRDTQYALRGEHGAGGVAR